jgi:cytochrome c5
MNLVRALTKSVPVASLASGIALCGALGARSLAVEPANISAIQSLKPGKGRELVQVNCMPCHSTAIIAATHATRARWDELITQMQQKNGLWPLVPTVRSQILDYLEATQPPSDPGLEAAKQTPWAKPLYKPNPLW